VTFYGRQSTVQHKHQWSCAFTPLHAFTAHRLTSAAQPQTACLPSNPMSLGLPFAIPAYIRKPLYNYHSTAVTLFVPRALCLRERHSNVCLDLLHACAQNVAPMHNSNTDPVTTNTKGIKRKCMVLPTAGQRTLAALCSVPWKERRCDVLALEVKEVGLTSQGKNIRKILNATGSGVIKIK